MFFKKPKELFLRNIFKNYKKAFPKEFRMHRRVKVVCL